MLRFLRFVGLASCLVFIGTAAKANDLNRVRGDDALLTLQVPTFIAPGGSDPDAIEPYFDVAGRVVRLSTTKGITFDPGPRAENFDQDEFDSALKAYASVGDCLLEDEQEKAQPDLTRFDWKALPNHGAAYACFLLIVSSYEKGAGVLWWMASQGMMIKRANGPYYLPGVNELGRRTLSEDMGLALRRLSRASLWRSRTHVAVWRV
ncbi:MAG: hypothetical protein AAF666_12030 [Pseudomonadota bacterium]